MKDWRHVTLEAEPGYGCGIVMRVDDKELPGTFEKWMVFLGAALVPLASWLLVPLASRLVVGGLGWDPLPIWLIPFVFFGPGFVLLVVRYWHSPRLGSYAGLAVTGFLFGYLVTGISGFLLLLYLLQGLGD